MEGGGSDIRDILELDQGSKFMTKDALMNDNKVIISHYRVCILRMLKVCVSVCVH